MRNIWALVAAAVLLAGCGGGSNQQDKTTAQSASPPPAAQDDGKGIGPIKEVTLGPIDAELAAQGKEIFDVKCAVCHKFEERYVGPALHGVTERRKPEWIMNMMLNPEQMIQEDPQAKALFAEYLTPMAFQNVTEDDAKLILMYIRSVEAEQGQ